MPGTTHLPLSAHCSLFSTRFSGAHANREPPQEIRRQLSEVNIFISLVPSLQVSWNWPCSSTEGHSPGRCSTRRSGSWHWFLPTLPPLLLPVQAQRLFSEHICGHIPFSSPNLSVPFAFLELCHTSLRLTRKAALTVFYLQR